MTTPFARCGPFVLLLVWLAGAPPVHGQSRDLSQLAVRVWTWEEGLPLDAARAVQQTADGYIWVGTESGLARFDGARFVAMDAPASPLYVSRDIMRLETGPGDTLWVATSTGLLRGREGVFQRWSRDAALGSGRIQALRADRDGRIWVGTAGAGLYVIASGIARPVAGGARHIRDISLSRSGGPWLATELGVGRVEGGRLATLVTDSAGRDVRSILEDGRGRLWAGTGQGLLRLEGDRLVHAAPSGPLRTAMIRSIREDARGDLWVAASGHGLYRLSAGVWDQLGPDAGLPGDDVHDLFTDARGDLWAAITGGLALIYAGDVLPITLAQGLGSPVALPVLEDRQGAVWVGTFGGGVTRLGPEGARTWGREDGLPNDVVLSLAEDAAGSIWVGTRAGVRIVDGTGVRRGPVRELDEASVPSLMRDRAGRMWVGTTDGVFLIDGGAVRSFGPEDGLSRAFVLTLAEARDGSVLIGTEGGGAYVIRDGRVGRLAGLPAAAAASIYAFHEDDDGTLWVAASQGLVRLRQGRRAVIGRHHGLPDQSVVRMFADDIGYYWLSTNHGVVRVPQAELHAAADGRIERISPRIFTRRDGMPSTETNGAFHPAGWQSQDGRLFVPTMGGVAVFDPGAIAEPTAPRVVVEGIAHDGSTVATPDLPPGADNISIDYAAIDYRLGDLAEFEYRLLGLDTAWTHAGTRRTAYYTRLPPRAFTFEVRGRLPGQPWDRAATASLAFRRLPQVWETPAFVGALVLLLAGLVFALDRWRVKGLRAREVELLALVRARESAERRYREIFENAREIVLTLDADGRIIEANQQAGVTLMRSPQDLAGITLASLAADPPVLARTRAGARDDEDSDGDGDLHELTLRTGADTSVRVEASIRTLEEDGRRVGYQLIGRDVTERHRLEERLRHSERMQAVGQLAGGIAHDFNNLLTAISGHAGFLLEGLDEGALRQEAVEIARGAERAAALTRQLLAFSRRQVLQPRVVDLNQVIARMEQLLRRLIGEHIAFAVELTAEPAHVRADVGQLEQVVANLAVNARDAMPGGGRLDVVTRSEAIDAPVLRGASLIPPNDYIVLDVSDTGIGMDPRTLSRIFEPFFTTKKVGEGTGLGLATVYGIIEQTGGYISVDSVPGAGTTFHIYLPRTADVPEPVSAPAAAVDVSGSDETILLVEDDDAVRRLIRRILEKNDYRVLEAANPRIALEQVLPQYTGRIVLLITDVVMPEMGGPEFAARATALRPGIRTIFISGYNDQTTAVNGELPIEHSFLGKPFTSDELLRKVRSVLDAAAEPT